MTKREPKIEICGNILTERIRAITNAFPFICKRAIAYPAKEPKISVVNVVIPETTMLFQMFTWNGLSAKLLRNSKMSDF